MLLRSILTVSFMIGLLNFVLAQDSGKAYKVKLHGDAPFTFQLDKIQIDHSAFKISTEQKDLLVTEIQKSLRKLNRSPDFGHFDIVIRQFEAKENKLPNVNQRIYLSADFIINKNEKSEKVYSTTTTFDTIGRKIPSDFIGRIFSSLINEFLKCGWYYKGKINMSTDTLLKNGIYSAPNEILNNIHSASFNHIFESKVHGNIWRSFLTDFRGEIIEDPMIFAFKTEEGIYLNANKFFPGDHFIKTEIFDKNLLIGQDLVFDYTEAHRMAATKAPKSIFMAGAAGAAVTGALVLQKTKRKAFLFYEMDKGTIFTIPENVVLNLLTDKSSEKNIKSSFRSADKTEAYKIMKELHLNGSLNEYFSNK